MRVTEKGQVTIPKELRDTLGIGAGTEVAFERADDAIVVRKVEGGSNRGREMVDRLRGRGDVRLSTGGDHGAHAAALIMAFGTLVDSNVLLDVITEDETWLEWSSNALASAADDGPLFINPIIYAEVSVRFSRIEDVEEALPPRTTGGSPCHGSRRSSLERHSSTTAGTRELGRRRSRTSSLAPTPQLRISGCLHATPLGTAPTSPRFSSHPLTRRRTEALSYLSNWAQSSGLSSTKWSRTAPSTPSTRTRPRCFGGSSLE